MTIAGSFQHPRLPPKTDGSPWPVKYLDLGRDPLPSFGDYARNMSIASSPEAHVLVTGHFKGGGITVYQYDPKEQTLDKTWVSDG